MGELRISSLSHEQIERICEIAEEAARRNITSRIPSRAISDLSISVDSEGDETLNVEIEVEITLSPLFKNIDPKRLAEESIKAAFEAVEKYLRETECHFNR